MTQKVSVVANAIKILDIGPSGRSSDRVRRAFSFLLAVYSDCVLTMLKSGKFY